MKAKLYFLYAVLILSFASAYTSDWEIRIETTLNGSSDSFIAGVGEPATDGYDNTADVIQPPQAPKGVQIRTLVDNVELTKDYRGSIELQKIWKLTLKANDPVGIGLSGLNELTWQLTGVPDDVDLVLIDYGEDAAKINAVTSIALKQQSSYSFDTEGASGPYRYIDLIAEISEVPEQQDSNTRTANTGGSLGGNPPSCTPSWRCTDWTACSSAGIRKRRCIDENSCGTAQGKPSEIESCIYVPEPAEEIPPENSEDDEDAEPDDDAEENSENPNLQQITGQAVAVGEQPSLAVGLTVMLVIVITGILAYFFIVRLK